MNDPKADLITMLRDKREFYARQARDIRKDLKDGGLSRTSYETNQRFLDYSEAYVEFADRVIVEAEKL